LEDSVVTRSQASGCNTDTLVFGQGGYHSILGLLAADTQDPWKRVTPQAFLGDVPK